MAKCAASTKAQAKYLLPFFVLPWPLAFAIAQLDTPHASAVRGKLPHGGEAVNLAGLQHDRQRQRLANAGDRQQRLKCRPQFHTRMPPPVPPG